MEWSMPAAFSLAYNYLPVMLDTLGAISPCENEHATQPIVLVQQLGTNSFFVASVMGCWVAAAKACLQGKGTTAHGIRIRLEPRMVASMGLAEEGMHSRLSPMMIHAAVARLEATVA